MLALGRVADRPAEGVRCRLALDQVVLRPGRDRREPGVFLGQAGQHDDRRRRGHGQYLRDDFQPAGVGQVQVQQDAAGDAVAAQLLLRLGQRARPHQGGADAAVGEQFFDQDHVPRIVLDQQQRLGAHLPGRVQFRR